MMQPVGSSYKVQRRVAGPNNIRLDGISDLLVRAKGKTVLDIGCNRGMVAYEFAQNYASAVHGCDIYEKGIETAREFFADIRNVESRFEVVDLTKGPDAFRKAFSGVNGYDIVVMLATYHKLKRIMSEEDLSALIRFFGSWTRKYFGWRGTSEQLADNEKEISVLDQELGKAGMKRIHTSYISNDLGVAAIWAR